MNWKVDSTIEPVIRRRDAFLYFCVSIALASFSFISATTFYTWASTIFFLLIGLVFLFVVLFPERFMRGIRMLDDGFECAWATKARVFVRFDDISLIEASSFESSETGERDIVLWIHSKSSTAVVCESDLFRTGLLERLEAFPGFDQTQITKAINFESSWYFLFFKKKFVVFVR